LICGIFLSNFTQTWVSAGTGFYSLNFLMP
jgi:hypothetical protein